MGEYYPGNFKNIYYSSNMKEYRVQVVATKTMVVSEADWSEEGGIGVFDEFQAAQFAKATLVEELRNNQNRGSIKVTQIK